jgi:hypothetical protein
MFTVESKSNYPQLLFSGDFLCLLFDREYVGGVFLRNFSEFPPENTASDPRRSYSLLMMH